MQLVAAIRDRNSNSQAGKFAGPWTMAVIFSRGTPYKQYRLLVKYSLKNMPSI
jgi:hypothetical protein